MDYFEVVENPLKQTERNQLLDWWNRYACTNLVIIQMLITCRKIFPNAKTTNPTAADVRLETFKLLNSN